MAGRREVPVDPAAGPVQRFAFELRKLRTEANGITYRALAERAGYSVTTLSQAAAGERLPTLPVALAYAAACGGDSAEWETRWKAAVEESAGDGFREEDGHGSRAPYRGLARFEAGDSDLFFGREQLTADLVDLLRRRRFGAVFGPSGSGKSSLLRAGLIPVLQRNRDPELRPAAIRILTPGEHPARSHASLLTPAIPRVGDTGADTFLVVDQFEEIFTLCHDAAERARFIELLLTARQPESRLRVLLAVRGDFYGRCAEHRDLADALRDANLPAGTMSRTELRDAVVKPATATGLTLERALTTRLVAEVADAPGGLPLLSHALLETWRRRRGKTLTMAGYEAAGCLDGAIARTAEQVYARFTEGQAAAARRVLLRMVAPGDGTPDTRRPVERAELADTGGSDTAQVVEALVGTRLLTLDGDTVELAHEALSTAWPRLRGWIEEDRERLRAHRALTEAARVWQDLGREKGALYRGSRLATAREHFGGAPRGELTALERAFLDAGRTHEKGGRRRYRLVLTAVTAALCLALVAAGLAAGQWRSAVTAQQEARSRQLAAQSGALLDSDPDLASLLAVHAFRTSPTGEATAALYAAAALPLRKRLVAGGSPVDAVALSPDGHTVATHSTDGRVRIWGLPEGRLRHTSERRGSGALASLVFSPDGRALAVAAGGVIRVRNPDTGRERGTLTVPGGSVRGIAFSPDGRTVAAASPKVVRVWDVTTGRVRHSFTDHPDADAVSFGPDGRTVAAASRTGPVRVWDLATGRTRTVHDSHIAGGAVAFGPDGRTVAFVVDDSVQVREVGTGMVRRTVKGGPAGANEVTFAPDGRTLAVSGPGDFVRLFDTASGTPRTTVTVGHRGRGVLDVALGADGSTLVTSGNLDPAVRVHRLTADHPRTVLPGDTGTHVADTGTHVADTDGITDILFSPDGRTVGTVRQGEPGRGAVQLWNARTGDREATLPLDRAPARKGKRLPVGVLRLGAVGFGPTGHALAARVRLRPSPPSRGSGAGDLGKRVIEVRDVATGRLRRSRAVSAVDKAVFSPDGTRLAIVGMKGSVRIWDLATGALHTAHAGRGQAVRTVTFAPDGRTLAVVDIESDGEQVTLLDAATGRPQRTIAPGARGPLSLAFSADGHTLATAGSGFLKTWDARTGRLHDTLAVDGEVSSTVFSPDGRTLATSGAKGVQLWDLATGRARLTLPIRSSGAVAFSPDGRVLALGADGAVGLWNVDLPGPARAIRDLCQAIDTTLSPRQQALYLGDRSTETGCRRGTR